METISFSKKLANLKAAVALHFAYYNFCRVHSSLRVTPAMEAGITGSRLDDCGTNRIIMRVQVFRSHAFDRPNETRLSGAQQIRNTRSNAGSSNQTTDGPSDMLGNFKC